MAEQPQADAARVHIERVSKTFGRVRALVSVTATLAPGVTVVRGTNGSGKSTLLGCLATLVRPTTGHIDYGPLGPATRVRETLGWVGHEALLYGDLTVEENVALAAALYGADEAVEGALARFELTALRARPVRLLSRGQRQRASLARALLHSPRLVLLDEPTTGLDPDGVSLLTRVILEEAARGAWVVVVTHDAAFLPGHPTLQMDRGRLTEAASP